MDIKNIVFLTILITTTYGSPLPHLTSESQTEEVKELTTSINSPDQTTLNDTTNDEDIQNIFENYENTYIKNDDWYQNDFLGKNKTTIDVNLTTKNNESKTEIEDNKDELIETIQKLIQGFEEIPADKLSTDALTTNDDREENDDVFRAQHNELSFGDNFETMESDQHDVIPETTTFYLMDDIFTTPSDLIDEEEGTTTEFPINVTDEVTEVTEEDSATEIPETNQGDLRSEIVEAEVKFPDSATEPIIIDLTTIPSSPVPVPSPPTTVRPSMFSNLASFIMGAIQTIGDDNEMESRDLGETFPNFLGDDVSTNLEENVLQTKVNIDENSPPNVETTLFETINKIADPEIREEFSKDVPINSYSQNENTDRLKDTEGFIIEQVPVEQTAMTYETEGINVPVLKGLFTEEVLSEVKKAIEEEIKEEIKESIPSKKLKAVYSDDDRSDMVDVILEAGSEEKILEELEVSKNEDVVAEILTDAIETQEAKSGETTPDKTNEDISEDVRSLLEDVPKQLSEIIADKLTEVETPEVPSFEAAIVSEIERKLATGETVTNDLSPAVNVHETTDEDNSEVLRSDSSVNKLTEVPEVEVDSASETVTNDMSPAVAVEETTNEDNSEVVRSDSSANKLTEVPEVEVKTHEVPSLEAASDSEIEDELAIGAFDEKVTNDLSPAIHEQEPVNEDNSEVPRSESSVNKLTEVPEVEVKTPEVPSLEAAINPSDSDIKDELAIGAVDETVTNDFISAINENNSANEDNSEDLRSKSSVNNITQITEVQSVSQDLPKPETEPKEVTPGTDELVSNSTVEKVSPEPLETVTETLRTLRAEEQLEDEKEEEITTNGEFQTSYPQIAIDNDFEENVLAFADNQIFEDKILTTPQTDLDNSDFTTVAFIQKEVIEENFDVPIGFTSEVTNNEDLKSLEGKPIEETKPTPEVTTAPYSEEAAITAETPIVEDEVKKVEEPSTETVSEKIEEKSSEKLATFFRDVEVKSLQITSTVTPLPFPEETTVTSEIRIVEDEIKKAEASDEIMNALSGESELRILKKIVPALDSETSTVNLSNSMDEVNNLDVIADKSDDHLITKKEGAETTTTPEMIPTTTQTSEIVTTQTPEDAELTPDEALKAFVDAIELTAEMAKSVNNFRELVGKNASVFEKDNEIVSAKNTRELVEVSGVGSYLSQNVLIDEQPSNLKFVLISTVTFSATAALLAFVIIGFKKLKRNGSFDFSSA